MSVSLARLLFISCLAAIGIARPALGNEAADRQAIEAAAQAWVKAFNARDADALLALATDDLILLGSNPSPARGQRAREAWKKTLGVTPGPITSVSKEIVVARDVAWRISVLANATTQAQIMEIWTRVEGKWKIHRQMSSAMIAQSNLSPTPTEPVLDRPAN